MTENVETAMLEILKRIQSDMSGVKADMSGVKDRLTGVEGRMERLEALVRKQGRDSAAMMIMMRGTVGIFDDRLNVIEEDVRLLMESE